MCWQSNWLQNRFGSDENKQIQILKKTVRVKNSVQVWQHVPLNHKSNCFSSKHLVRKLKKEGTKLKAAACCFYFLTLSQTFSKMPQFWFAVSPRNFPLIHLCRNSFGFVSQSSAQNTMLVIDSWEDLLWALLFNKIPPCISKERCSAASVNTFQVSNPPNERDILLQALLFLNQSLFGLLTEGH